MSNEFFINKPEILAPVGGPEQLVAAVRCGADAVYFGMQDFNARRNAKNFADENLAQTIKYCHTAGTKVYITINTLIMDDEIAAAHAAIDRAAEAGADALIVQDLSIASYVKRHRPGLELHASTQMAVHSAEGVKLLQDYGFKRMVLARELSLEEIRAIIDETGAELECFVHGAHCMSVSGNCYMSSMIGARSGNRGLCAQPCRLDWKLGKKDHCLSLKDMSYMPFMKELAEAGIKSLKIEGRMKRAEYVAAAVSSCRAAIEGKEPDLETLQAIFSRSGFTSGYLEGKTGPQMFGYRTKEDVVAAEGVLKNLERLYDKEDAKLPVSMFFSAKEEKHTRLSVSCDGLKAESFGDIPEPAMNVALNEERAIKSLGKTGGTDYELKELVCDIDPGLMVPASALNALRRNCLESLDNQRIEASKHPYIEAADPVINKYEAPEKAQIRLRFERADQIFENEDCQIVLPFEEIEKKPGLLKKYEGRIIAEIPALLYGKDEAAVKERLAALKLAGLTDIISGNPAGIKIAKDLNLNAHGGFELNILNSEALAEYEAIGLKAATISFELSFDKMKKLRSGLKRGAVVYGYLPMMKLRSCPARTEKGCAGCNGLNKLTDRMAEEFTLICRNRRYSELLNCVPLYVGDKQRPALDFETLYFTTESPKECLSIYKMYIAGEPAPFRKTAGLYFRQLL